MRRLLLCASLTLAALGPLVAPGDASADFDPSGRGPRKKHPPAGAGAKPGPATNGPRKPRKPAKDDEDAKGPSADALIARYTTIVLGQPGQPFPLQRLAQLYRERDGNLKKLVDDFEKRVAAGGAEGWASRVVLAGVYKVEGRYDEAIRTYQQAIAERPKDASPILALAQLESDRGDKIAARADLERALPLLKAGVDLEQTTRALLALCLDLQDFEGAKRHHDALAKAASGSLFVKAELGRELLARGYYERAEAEFQEVVKAAVGDNRALAPALRDLGQAQAKQKKMTEALATLKRAMAIAGSAAGVRAEILLIMTDAYRAENKLPELIALLEADRGGDVQRLSTMGGLYEEVGEVDKAIATYKKALGADPKLIDVRVKLVHLLQTAGELDAAIKEYEALIRAAPNMPEFVFELCDTLIQRGDRAKALRLAQELEGRSSDPGIQATVADFYERIDEKDRAMKVRQKLAQSGGADPQYVIDLGDRYFQNNDKKRALETWARIRSVVPDRAKAAAILGEVYLDHDMPAEAIAALREAVQIDPKSARAKKALALGLERTAASLPGAQARYGEARVLWEDLLASAGPKDKVLAREARTAIVKLWGLTRELAAQVAPLSARFAATPPDLDAGRLLAEVERKLHRPEAEATLRQIIALAPGDDESLLALERLLVLKPDLAGAIEVLGKLVEVDPKRAKEFYQRMGAYAADIQRDDDAIRYHAKAVELDPKNAEAHEKLGEMYRRKQDLPRAIAEFRLAIQHNERLFKVYLDLGDLLLAAGQVEEADRLFRRVIRASPDEEQVARAARTSMRVNLTKGTLPDLERELFPVAVGNPQKTIYRRLLVQLYGDMTFPLVQKLRGSDPRSPAAVSEARAARAELAKIGARAVKPLLDALADEHESQQKIAIEVLAYVENKSAGPALYNYATSTADKSLRVRAMIACGGLRDPGLLARYGELLAPREGAAWILPSDSIAVAAAWSVARMGDRRAEPLLLQLLGSSSPDVRALAAIGLGLTHDKRHAAVLTSLARASEASPLARAAAMHALAEIGAEIDPALLLANAGANDPTLRQAALFAMGRVHPAGDPQATGAKEDLARSASAEAIGAAVFSPDESLRSAGVLAATALATHRYVRAREPLPVPDGPLVLREVLAGLGPDASSPSARAEALVALGPALRRDAVAAVATSPERARVVADALLGGDGSGSRGLLPFTAPGEKLDPKLAAQVAEVAESIARAVVPGFVALERHPSVDVRTRAVEFLARRAEPEAQAALVDALADPDEAVRRAALASIGGPGADSPAVTSDGLVKAVTTMLKDSPSWPLRVRAAEALGRVGRVGGGPNSSALVVATLLASAKGDAFALVREASARALAVVDPSAARPVLEGMAASDAEPRVREAATELLAKK